MDDFNHYFTNQELDHMLPEWARTYQHLLTLSTLGESHEKLPIWLLTLTNSGTGKDIDKPAMWVDANIHAVEVAGTTTALRLVQTLLEGYGKDERLTRLLDQNVVYVAPRLNPDGAALAMATPPRFVRSGVRAYPYPEKADGLHEQDVDGDGRVLQMRLVDPSGDWKVSSLDPRLMEKRQPDEFGGTYYRLFPEGLIENFDGYLIDIARPQADLDFNRNFPFDWKPEGDQHGAGPYPTSEPEIRAVTEFISQHPNINVALSYHTFSRALLRPFSTKPDEEMETEDLWVYKKLGEIGTRLTGYRCVSTFHDFKYHPKEVTYGAFDDWLYDYLGVFTFTVELWDLPTEAGVQDRKFIEWFRDHSHEEDLLILKWADENAAQGAYVDWYPFDHPQLGPLELGGWDFMYTWGNPPHAWMSAEAERNVHFALAMTDLLPKLTIHTLKIKPLGEGFTHIQLVVENQGFLPTYTSQQAQKRKAIRPVRAELELPPEAKLVKGKNRVELGHLEGRSNKLELATVFAESPTDNRTHTEWVVQASSGSWLTLKVLSERAGGLQRRIQIP